jgi:Domain of unknown function (DUF4129)
VSVRRSFLRPALLAAAVLALLAVVALASRADRPARPPDPDERTLPIAFWDYLLTFAALAVVVMLALAVYLKVPLPRKADRAGFGVIQFFAFVAIMIAIASLGTRVEWPEITQPGEEAPFVEGRERQGAARQQTESSERDSQRVRLRWEAFAAGGALLLLGFGIYAARRRGDARRRVQEQAASALSAAVDDSLDDLRAEADPRRAVIAAYARMERALDGQGLPRRRSEAPLEYLGRVLATLRVRSSAVLALTELFERAKFSRHEIDAEMKDEAIGALVAVRNDLGALGAET